MAGGHARQWNARRSTTRSAARSTSASVPSAGPNGCKNYSVKVINELRLDLSTERGQEEYDRYMREFLGLD